MKAGQLRHVISFHRRNDSFDELGHANTSPWKPFATGIRAQVLTLSGRELEQARKLHADATVQVTTRYTGAKSTDRIHFGKRILEIAMAKPNDRDTNAIYLCVEDLD